jgi:hypothetical protein
MRCKHEDFTVHHVESYIDNTHYTLKCAKCGRRGYYYEPQLTHDLISWEDSL